MIERQIAPLLDERLAFYPGMVLLGPRQVGKTTLARALAARHAGVLFLDLERPADRAQLAEPELFLARHRDKLVVLDEVQMLPELFTHLRPEIDADRRPGRFLLLGSASGALLRQRAESLAGRVGYLDLTPLLVSEVAPDLERLQQLWHRGGFPQAWLAPSDRLSYAWRQDFIQTFLQRDLPQMGVSIAADTLHRFWRMLAHLQGQMFNASQLGQSLGGASHTTTTRYLGTLVDTLLVRRLEPHLPNVGKRLVKSPKVYIRDSGLLHALLNIASLSDLQGHPIVGASWEGFVVEQVAAHLHEGAQLGFYRTAAGAEMDMVVQAGRRSLAIEVKFASAPSVTKGFWHALADLQPTRTVVVAPVERPFPLKDGVDVVPVWALPDLLAELG
jgi:predicted AAA+ superfamily ATPase